MNLWFPNAYEDNTPILHGVQHSASGQFTDVLDWIKHQHTVNCNEAVPAGAAPNKGRSVAAIERRK
jgi:hypothetical protein